MRGLTRANLQSVIRRTLARVVCAGLLCAAAQAEAQTNVRVKQDHTTIWRPGFRNVADVVKAGTVLEVLRRDNRWFEVRLPIPDRVGSTGMIAVAQVEAVDPSEPPAPSVPAPTASTAASQAPAVSSGPPFGSSGVAIRGFGQIGYGRFAASKSFDAVLDTSGGLWFGGGVQILVGPGFFVDGSVEYFGKNGERVFVSGDDVFKLGVRDEIRITPLVVTAGYRYPGRRWAPYAGGGVGSYIYKEDSDFADDAENVSISPTSYHIVGGVEWVGQRSIGTAVEVAYTWVPDALNGGVSAIFDEHDLGNFQVRLRVLFGR